MKETPLVLHVCLYTEFVETGGLRNHMPSEQTFFLAELHPGKVIEFKGEGSVCVSDVSESEVTLSWLGGTYRVELDGVMVSCRYSVDNPLLSESHGFRATFRSLIPDLDVKARIEAIRRMPPDDPKTVKLRNQVLYRLDSETDCIFDDPGMWIARAVLNTADDWATCKINDRMKFAGYMATAFSSSPHLLEFCDRTGWKWLETACRGGAFDSYLYDMIMLPVSDAVIRGVLDELPEAIAIYEHFAARVSKGLEDSTSGFRDPLPTLAKYVVMEVKKISQGKAYHGLETPAPEIIEWDRNIEEDLLRKLDEVMADRNRPLADRVGSATFELGIRLKVNMPVSDNWNLIRLKYYRRLIGRVNEEAADDAYDSILMQLTGGVCRFCAVRGYWYDLKSMAPEIIDWLDGNRRVRRHEIDRWMPVIIDAYSTAPFIQPRHDLLRVYMDLIGHNPDNPGEIGSGSPRLAYYMHQFHKLRDSIHSVSPSAF